MATMKDSILNSQYQFSKLFNVGLTRKKFDCVSTKSKLFAMNTSKNTFIALLITFLASGQLFSGFIVAYNSTEKLGTDFFITFSISFIVGLIGLRQFLWLINGRQEMTIENGVLTLYKKGTFITKPRVFSFEKIENIREAIDDNKLSIFAKIQQNAKLNRKLIFGQVNGEILFDYNGQTIKLFCDLDKNEKLEVINAMKTAK